MCVCVCQQVHAITLNGEPLAVKVMPLYDINTARPYHFRDICTTFLRHQRSPYIEMPLHTFLRCVQLKQVPAYTESEIVACHRR